MLHAVCLVAAALAAGQSPLVGRVSVPDLGRPVTWREDLMVAFVGTSVAYNGATYAALGAVNVTAADNPVLMDPLSLNAVNATVQAMVLANNRSYVVCTDGNETTVHDVAADPSRLDQQSTPAAVEAAAGAGVVGLSFFGSNLFVLFADSLEVYSTAVAGRPILSHTAKLTKLADATAATGIVVERNIAYITCTQGTQGIVLLDVTKADNPSFIDTVLTLGAPTALASSEDGEVLYVSSFVDAASPVLLEAYDVSNGQSPYRIANHTVTSAPVTGLSTSEDYIMLATASEIVLLSHVQYTETADSFAELGRVAYTAAPTGVLVTPDYTYVVDSDGEFTVFNTTAITNPQPIPSPPHNGGGGGGTSAGTKVGIAFAVIASVAVVALIGFYVHRRQRVAAYSAIN